MGFDCSFLIGGEHTNGLLIQANKLTVWVLLEDRSIVKRHKVKHGVKLSEGLENSIIPWNDKYKVYLKPEHRIYKKETT